MGELKSLTINGKKYDKWAEEKYELIDSVTVSEAGLTSFEKTWDKAYRKYIFIVRATSYLDGGYLYLQARDVSVYDGPAVGIAWGTSWNACARILIWQENGIWQGYGMCGPYQNYSTTFGGMTSCHNMRWVENTPNLTNVNLWMNGSSTLPASFTVQIYGAE